MDKNFIINKLSSLKPKYEKDGLIILGLFGSYVKNQQTKYSDIDIAYKLDYEKFSLKYKDGFSKLLRIDEIKKDLENIFKTKIDLVPDNNKNIFSEIVYV